MITERLLMPYVLLAGHWIMHAAFLGSMIVVHTLPDVFEMECNLPTDKLCHKLDFSYSLMFATHAICLIVDASMQYLELY